MIPPRGTWRSFLKEIPKAPWAKSLAVSEVWGCSPSLNVAEPSAPGARWPRALRAARPLRPTPHSPPQGRGARLCAGSARAARAVPLYSSRPKRCCCGAAAAVPVLLQGLGNERTLRCPSAYSSSGAGTRPNCLPRDGRGAGSKAQIPSVPSPAPLLSSSCCRLHAQHSHAQPRSRRSTASPLSEHYNPQQAPRQEAPLYHRP